MPDITVEFKCEKCGGLLHKWTRQTVDSMPDNAMYMASDYCRHNERRPDYLVCRNCQKTVVYDDVIYVEHDPSRGKYSEVKLKTGARGNEYFAIGASTMDAICDAWQKHRYG
jgi:hypothetical protein